jgi:hypothetical protein
MDQTLSRRSGLITGAKLAFAAPAVVAALRAGVASADTGAQTAPSAPSAPSTPSSGQIPGTAGLTRLAQAELCPTAGNTGRAVVQVLSTNGTTPNDVFVSIAGAATGQTYNLVFTPQVGSATTILSGNVGPTSNPGGNYSNLFTSVSGLPTNLNDLRNGTFTLTNSSNTTIFQACGNGHKEGSAPHGLAAGFNAHHHS